MSMQRHSVDHGRRQRHRHARLLSVTLTIMSQSHRAASGDLTWQDGSVAPEALPHDGPPRCVECPAPGRRLPPGPGSSLPVVWATDDPVDDPEPLLGSLPRLP